jgi:mono/diheme cytochrome c family protein
MVSINPAVARRRSMAIRLRWLCALLLWQLTAGVAIRASDEGPSFEREIAPILQAHCVKCHGGEKLEAGLDLRRHATMLKGGDSGAALAPGRPDESLLFQRISAGEMPPQDEGRLDDAQRELVRRWIAAGATLSGMEDEPFEVADAPARVSDEDRAFWAFQPPVRPGVPVVKNQDRVRTPVDSFLLAKLEEKELSFNDDAPLLVLLRRACFDLHGLPPTPDQIDEFLADVQPGAYERLIDRLLASPRYGERWGRHWLDVAGYADSDGYLAADRVRPEAWRYRDYVIRALNADLPYDHFVQQQLAGDELVDWRHADELTSEMIDCLVATGFLRTASDPTYPGYTEPNEIHQVLADTLQIVGTTFLGLTVQCARCHTHKFDPVTQRDYYAMQAVFLGALDPARWQPSETRGIPLATESQQARLQEHNQRTDERLAYLNASLAEVTARFRKKLVGERLAALPADRAAAVTPQLVDSLVAALLLDEGKRNDEQKQLVAQYVPGISLAETELAARYAEYKHEAARLQAAVAAEAALKKSVPLVRGLIDLDGAPAQGRVLRRGDHNQPGAEVEPQVLAVLAPADFKLTPQPGYKTSGRRAAFVRWLTDANHPLIARTEVNRIWAHHFGRGLVATPANFGRSGARPSHPELLDWLAGEFVRQGWSRKAMHKLLICSTAYRQSSADDAAKAAIDPDNHLLWSWQPRRHEGEVLRDTVLAVAGRLNGQMQGPPVPVAPQPDGSVATSEDESGRRRSIYLIVRRSQHLTMLDLFDTPMMEINCPQRSESIVPLQALALLHGPFTERYAAALAVRIVGAAAEKEARIEFAFKLLFARQPSSEERWAMNEFLETVARELPGAEPDAAAWTQAALVLLNSNEFIYVH